MESVFKPYEHKSTKANVGHLIQTSNLVLYRLSSSHCLSGVLQDKNKSLLQVNSAALARGECRAAERMCALINEDIC